MAQGHEVTLDFWHEIANQLHLALGPCLGPNFQSTLIVNATGEIVLTNEGTTIVESLSNGSPLVNTLLSCVKKHRKIYGDGSKSMLLMLSEFLKSLDQHFTRSYAGTYVNVKNTMLKSLETFHTDIIQEKLDKMKELSVQVNKEDKSLYKQTIRNLLKGTLCTKLSSSDADFLSCLVSDYLFSWGGDITVNVQLLLDHYLSLVVQWPNHHSQHSKQCQGLYISRGFTSRDLPLTFSPVRFVLLNNNLELDNLDTKQNSRQKISLAASPATYSQLLYSKTIQARKFLGLCKKAKVNLIICRNGCSDQEKSLCFHYQIHLIHAVDEKEFSTLQLLSRTQVIESPSEYRAVENLPGVCVGEAASATQVILCGKPYVNLVLSESQTKLPDIQSESTKAVPYVVNVSTLLVCGPTSGMCHQVWEAINMSLLSMKFALSSGDGHLHVFPCGGSYEALLCALVRKAMPEASGDIKTVGTLFEKAVMTLPQLLHRNAVSVKKPRWCRVLLDWTMHCNQVVSGQRSGCHDGLVALSPLHGDLRTNSGSLESIESKQGLINEFLTILMQVLKLDLVTFAKKSEKRLQKL